ncbi:recombinase-like helix-turn-helix domain-containing protein [Zooshikella sp. RANM57]|uniref:recombinase-like helix-turn-helix domain-containing protein n=1 Tax=Zooshikella sp. RANM57 TaxID=3425863 RepID=UPI003D6EC936
MKDLKVEVKKRSAQSNSHENEVDEQRKHAIQRLLKKHHNIKQICQKLNEQAVTSPDGQPWHYEMLVAECQRLKIALH